MTQQIDTNKATKPNSQPQTGPTSSGGDTAYRVQVAAEIAQLRNQVNQALNGQQQGIQAVITEYQETAQPLIDASSLAISDMVLGGSFFGQIGQNVASIVAAHPTGSRAPITVNALPQISFRPLPSKTPLASLTGTASAHSTN